MDVQQTADDAEKQEEKVDKVVEIISVNKQTEKEDNDIDYEQEEIPDNNFTELSISAAGSTLTNYQDVQEAAIALDSMKILANNILRGKMCPLKSVDDIIFAILAGNQFGFNYMISITNIYPIKGKPTMSTHLIRAQILKNGILFKKINDYEPIYNFYKKKEGAQPVIVFTGTVKEQPEDTIKGTTIVDYITTYQFTRWLKTPVGYKEMNIESSFKMTDGGKAGLLEKDNWINWPARMLDSRAFNFGAREIADDIIHGMYSVSELAEINNMKYTISNTLEEQVVYKE